MYTGVLKIQKMPRINTKGFYVDFAIKSIKRSNLNLGKYLTHLSSYNFTNTLFQKKKKMMPYFSF